MYLKTCHNTCSAAMEFYTFFVESMQVLVFTFWQVVIVLLPRLTFCCFPPSDSDPGFGFWFFEINMSVGICSHIGVVLIRVLVLVLAPPPPPSHLPATLLVSLSKYHVSEQSIHKLCIVRPNHPRPVAQLTSHRCSFFY